VLFLLFLSGFRVVKADPLGQDLNNTHLTGRAVHEDVEVAIKGVFKLGGLEVYCQPMSLYDGQISRFGRETLKNIVTTGNSLEGTISLSKNKLLCVSIPYLDEWVAYVDDQPAELLHINTAFMGVELSAGDHTVKFVYHMKGLKAGAILSGMGALCLIGLIIYSNKRKRSGILT